MPTGWSRPPWATQRQVEQIKEELLGQCSIDFLILAFVQDMQSQTNTLLNAHTSHTTDLLAAQNEPAEMWWF